MQCRQFITNLEKVCFNKSSPFVVEETLGHATSHAWQINRWCRVTASNAKDIKCVKAGIAGLVNRLLWLDPPTTAAIQYGRDHESNAFFRIQTTASKLYSAENRVMVKSKASNSRM